MNILVACEESQAVTKELRRLGHRAFSCDIEPCSGGHEEWHIQADVLPLLDGDCCFITQDGVRHFQGLPAQWRSNGLASVERRRAQNDRYCA